MLTININKMAKMIIQSVDETYQLVEKVCF